MKKRKKRKKIRKIRRPLPLLAQDFARKLELGWPVLVEVITRGDMMMTNSELDNLKERKGHHLITAPRDYLKNPVYYRVDWAHELCHLFLAERLDLIFSGAPVVGEVDPAEKERRVQLLFYAQLHMDLLVNDARDFKLGRELTVEDVRSMHQSFLRIAEEARINPEAREFFDDPRLPWQLALNIVEDERHNLGLGVIEVLDLYDFQSRQYIEKIIEIYRELPALSWQPDQDLSAFEKSVQRVVEEILKADFVPRIISHPEFPGRRVWSIE